jgi:hypothetical protein
MKNSISFGLSLSFDTIRMVGIPFALSLSKGYIRQTLRHGAFDFAQSPAQGERC